MNDAEALAYDMAVAARFSPRRPSTLCRECSGGGRVANGTYGPTRNGSRQIICQSCHGTGQQQQRRSP